VLRILGERRKLHIASLLSKLSRYCSNRMNSDQITSYSENLRLFSSEIPKKTPKKFKKAVIFRLFEAT
jgi:hypothetical protein